MSAEQNHAIVKIIENNFFGKVVIESTTCTKEKNNSQEYSFRTCRTYFYNLSFPCVKIYPLNLFR